LPTMLAMAGIELPKGVKIDGLDIMPVMKGDILDLGRDLFWRQKEQRAIRSGKWKLVIRGANGAPKEMFDLSADLPESKNIIADHPEVARELEEKIERWEAEVSRAERLS